jgi:hypothetical protein
MMILRSLLLVALFDEARIDSMLEQDEDLPPMTTTLSASHGELEFLMLHTQLSPDKENNAGK